VTSAGREPAQPASADARVRVAGRAAWRRKRARASAPPNDSPATCRVLQAEALDEAGQAVGVAGHAERLGRVGGPTGARGVPGDHGQLVAEPLQLRPPGGRAVTDVAVEQDQRWPVASAFVGDAEPVDLGRLHGGARRSLPGRPWADGRGS